MPTQLIYSPEYDYQLGALSVLHPFEGCKYSKAWKRISATQPALSKKRLTVPESAISSARIAAVHDSEYLCALKTSSAIARVVEVPLLQFIPAQILQQRLLKPALWACEGTRLAVDWALENKGLPMNIGGGFHHAYSDHGEGFCFYADAAMAVASAKQQGKMQSTDVVWLIDLDAHRGNGYEATLGRECPLSVFDMYNFQVYPGLHPESDPFMFPLKAYTNDRSYLEILHAELPAFVASSPSPALIFYNAGTDVVQGDKVGRLGLSVKGVIERDLFVLEVLSKLNIPTVVLTSGGYNSDSPELIATLALNILASGD